MNYYRRPMIITSVLMVVSIFLVICFSNGYSHGSTMTRSQMYSMVGEVIEVNRSEDYIAIENTAGDIYRWTSAEWWQIGDIIAMTMDDMGTDDVTDDEILDMSLAWAAE